MNATPLFVRVHDRFTLLAGLIPDVPIFVCSPAVVFAVRFPAVVTLPKAIRTGVYAEVSPISNDFEVAPVGMYSCNRPAT